VEGYIRERLDTIVANQERVDMFLGYEVTNGEQRHSNHRPIILSLEGRNNMRVSGLNPHFFKFEARWLQEGCAELVEKAWAESFSAGSLTVKEGL
jgi:hypothetical protein